MIWSFRQSKTIFLLRVIDAFTRLYFSNFFLRSVTRWSSGSIFIGLHEEKILPINQQVLSSSSHAVITNSCALHFDLCIKSTHIILIHGSSSVYQSSAEAGHSYVPYFCEDISIETQRCWSTNFERIPIPYLSCHSKLLCIARGYPDNYEEFTRPPALLRPFCPFTDESTGLIKVLKEAFIKKVQAGWKKIHYLIKSCFQQKSKAIQEIR